MASTTTVPTDHASVVRRLIYACVLGDYEAAKELVTDNVTAWSPVLTATSRDELMEAFEDRVGAFTNLEAQVDGVDVLGEKAFAEWRMSAEFSGELEMEDITVPPTGKRVYLAGATVAEFDGDRIRAFRHYFDDAALLEQLLGLG